MACGDPQAGERVTPASVGRVTDMHTAEARGTGMAMAHGLLLFPIGNALAPNLGSGGFAGRVIGGFIGSATGAERALRALREAGAVALS